ncbi:uncharacterized protein B0H18DRAFT_1215072 [Fomitopsis serialis]|uniref:uncharacterized protein n=1 Tax=Fomitopsis serialis TaxID=139415 RepID=UPI002008391A|nr:uncharacterized protein B0H18DRAFT_1215072 [Neoantrodia serialis]KAH9916464.1 hypothetical protein B0H18DRAFT_1215072 [Neoantrodia serialis]
MHARLDDVRAHVSDIDFNARLSIFAIVAKDELEGIRARGWDLSFTKTTDHRGRHPHRLTTAATLPLIQAAFHWQLVDTIAGEDKATGIRGGLGAQLRPETKNKPKKVREEIVTQNSEEAKREQKEEEEEKRAAAKRKVEEDRLSKLSAVRYDKTGASFRSQASARSSSPWTHLRAASTTLTRHPAPERRDDN